MTVRICVVGCGAIGSLFAAHLSRVDDVEVWAYDVSAEHVAAINADGLRLTGRADFVARFEARTDGSAIPPCDFGIVAVKSEFTTSAMSAVADVFADGAVVSLQNGIGNEELVAETAPRVMRGTTLPAGAVTAPGVVSFDASGGTWIGPFEPKPASMAEVERLAALITEGGLPTHALADARGAQWTKLVFNCATNPLGALTGLSIGQLCDVPSLRILVSGLIAEGVAVADALGIVLDSDPEKMIDAAVADNYWHKASMLQDALRKRRTEIDVLNGGIVREGRAVGVATPLHEAVVAMMEGLEDVLEGNLVKLTHFGHACVLVETDSARIMIDPEVFSSGFEGVTDLDAVLITHQHGDHLDLDRIPALLAANPKATFYIDADSAPLTIEAGLTGTVVAPSDRLEIAGSVVDVLGGIHEPVFGAIPGCTNAAFLVDDGAFFHPGDSFFVPDQDVDVLALPMSGPWLKVRDAVEYVQAVTPRVAVPVHELALRNEHSHDDFLIGLKPQNTEFTPLEPGESTAL